MNAAYFRTDAVQRLTNLSPQIALHIAKVASLPKSEHVAGWQRELDAWRAALSLVHHGKKGRENLSLEMIFEEVFERHLEGEEDQANLLRTVTKSGIDVSGFSFDLAKANALFFAEAVINETPFKVITLG